MIVEENVDRRLNLLVILEKLISMRHYFVQRRKQKS